MKLPSLLLIMTLGLAASACGENIYACDIRPDEDRCQERTTSLPASEQAFKGTCEASQSTFLTDGCPRDGAVGGCDITTTGSGENVVNIYYAPKTASEVEQICMDEGSTFVANP